MERVEVPVAWVSSFNDERLGLCARHGEPAEDEREVQFHPKMPTWTWIALPPLTGALFWAIKTFGIAVSAVALLLLALDKEIFPQTKVENWPFCARCLALGRLRLLGITVAVLGFFGAFLVALLLMTGAADNTVVYLGFVACLGLVAGAVLKEKFAWRRIARGRGSKDQSSVEVKAHARFAAAVRDRLSRAREVTAPPSMP